jgi:isocitrate dehydrogenase
MLGLGEGSPIPVRNHPFISIAGGVQDGPVQDLGSAFDFTRLMKAEGVKDVKKVKCSEFADAIIANR